MEKQIAIETLEKLQYRVEDISRNEMLAIGTAIVALRKELAAKAALSAGKVARKQ